MRQRPTRILYVARTARGGSAFSLYHLVRGLDRRLFEPSVLFYTQDDPYLPGRLKESGIRLAALANATPPDASRPSLSGKPAPRRDIAAWLATHVGRRASAAYRFAKAAYQFVREDLPRIGPIRRAIRQTQADLVHVNTSLRHGKAAIVAARWAGVPCVCHVRMFEELGAFDRLFAPWVRRFLCISSAVQARLTEQGIAPARCQVVHNAVDLSEYARTPDPVEVRREFGWPAETPLVGVVGRLDWWKGHEYFLHALAEISRQMPSVRGLVIGEPETTPVNRDYHARLQALTQALGLTDKVIFTGFRADVPRLMGALDVVVLSSAEPEPFGRVVIEAMAAGRPVVATAAGGVLDVIEDGANGVLVPPRDASALGAAIVAILRDPPRARRIGQAARQRVLERFSLEEQVNRIEGLYAHVLRLV